MEWWLAGIILTVCLILLLMIGTPIYVSLGGIAAVGLILVLGFDKAVRAFGTLSYSTADSFLLVAIPMFIFMAEIVMFSGAGHDLFSAMEKWFAGIPGGSAIATTAACGVFAAVCGASVATAATVGVISIPEMMKQGYDKKLTVGVVAAAGAVGILIPPSIPMIIYCFITEQSVGQLFMAGFLPGIVFCLVYAIAIVGYVKINPHWAPAHHAYSMKEKLLAFKQVSGVVALIIMVLGTIYTGLGTPTEAASMGALGALLIALISRKLNWANLRPALLRTIQTSSFIMIIIIAAKIFGLLLANLQIPQMITRGVASMEVNRWWVQIAMQGILFIGGCFLDVGSLLLITMPILFPISQALGFDPIWFGVIVTINMEMAVITPPVGLNLYVIAGVAERFKITLWDVIQGAMLFLPFDIVILGIIMAFPDIALWLPSQMLK